MDRKIQAEFSMVFNGKKMPMTYFGWPTVAKLKNGHLVAGASGFRYSHVCPFGKSIAFESADEGKSWGKPKIVYNSLVDDRDAGITPLKDGGYLVSLFATDTRQDIPWFEECAPDELSLWKGITDQWTDEAVWKDIGSFLIPVSADGTVGKRIEVPVSTPHGPIWCGDELFYLGWPFRVRQGRPEERKTDHALSGGLELYVSTDEGKTWTLRSKIPAPEDSGMLWEEPTVVQTPDGTILAEIRCEGSRADTIFSTWQCESKDRGCTWTVPHKIVDHGSPPSVLCHSSGVLVLVYTYRREPNGIRAKFSRDNGNTWSEEYILCDHCPSGDCGYPSSVELSDGSILTVWYRQGGEDNGLEQARWTLPEF